MNGTAGVQTCGVGAAENQQLADVDQLLDAITERVVVEHEVAQRSERVLGGQAVATRSRSSIPGGTDP